MTVRRGSSNLLMAGDQQGILRHQKKRVDFLIVIWIRSSSTGFISGVKNYEICGHVDFNLPITKSLESFPLICFSRLLLRRNSMNSNKCQSKGNY
jgi:hypothetical protein